MDKIQQIHNLNARLAKIREEKEAEEQEVLKQLIPIKETQKRECEDKLYKILNNRHRYTKKGLTEAVQEICPNITRSQETSYSYYDRMYETKFRCDVCGYFRVINE